MARHKEDWLSSHSLAAFAVGYSKSDPVERLLVHMALDLSTTRREFSKSVTSSDDWFYRFSRAWLLNLVSVGSTLQTNKLKQLIDESYYAALCELS